MSFRCFLPLYFVLVIFILKEFPLCNWVFDSLSLCGVAPVSVSVDNLLFLSRLSSQEDANLSLVFQDCCAGLLQEFSAVLVTGASGAKTLSQKTHYGISVTVQASFKCMLEIHECG